jgi:hypothetical protein
MTWFAASLLFEASHSEQTPDAGLWEESVVLIFAQSADAAKAEASALGASREHSYPAQGADVVTWKFRRIERVFEIESESLKSGTEVLSRYLRPSEVASLLTPFDETPKSTD